MNGHAQWSSWPKAVRIDVSGKVISLCVGDCFTYKGRNGIVRVEKFSGNEAEVRGIVYLPWRGDRWATPRYTVFGSSTRFIKLPPASKAYNQGECIDLTSIRVVADPSA
jgi:hypothetical protein